LFQFNPSIENFGLSLIFFQPYSFNYIFSRFFLCNCFFPLFYPTIFDLLQIKYHIFSIWSWSNGPSYRFEKLLLCFFYFLLIFFYDIMVVIIFKKISVKLLWFHDRSHKFCRFFFKKICFVCVLFLKILFQFIFFYFI